MTFRNITAALVACLVSATAGAQLMTLSQSTNPTTVTAGASVACAVGNPASFTVDNGYFRSYPLAGLPSNIDIVSISFGVENVASTVGAFPLQIRLYNDANGGVPSPFSSLTLRHTESFTLLPSAIPMVVTQAITGPTVTFTTTETLVVEVFSPTGGTAGNLFFIGANALGQSAPCYIRAANCGINDPTTFAAINNPNTHIIVDVNYVPSGQSVTFPGTGEDFTLFTGVNANPPTTGVGNSVKSVTAADNLTARVVSTGGTFNFRELVVIAQGYPTGAPPFPPIAPNVHMTFPGLVFLLGGVSGPLGPVLLPPGGTTLVFTVPPGLAGSSVLLQGVVITWTAPFATNGLYASTDAHEINIM